MLTAVLRSLVVLVTTGFVLASAQTAQAQVVGTHLGEGDLQAQTAIANWLIQRGVGPNFPITVQIDAKVSPNEVGLQQLGEASRTGPFFTIVRINDVCKASSEYDFGQLGNVIRTNFGTDPNRVAIVFGNEVNNRDVECPSWEVFDDNYRQFINQNPDLQPISGPSPVDYYNAVFQAADFLNVAGSVYSQPNGVNFGNAYGCVGVNKDGCFQVGGDAVTFTGPTDTFRAGLVDFDFNRNILTEFSLSPESNRTDAPDTNLIAVLQFITEFASQTGAEYITPLVRNVCNDDSQWLLFVDGEFFSFNRGQVSQIDPVSCSGGTALAPKDYLIYPIRGLFDPFNLSNNWQEAGPDLNIDQTRLIIDSLAEHGYQAMCTTPKQTLRAVFGGDIDAFNQYGGSRFTAYPEQIGSNYIIDLTSAQVPLWRADNQNSLFASLETYWGWKNPDPLLSPNQKNVLSSAPFSLLSKTQQCSAQLDVLATAHELCQGQSECGLNSNIADTGIGLLDLYNRIRDWVPAEFNLYLPQQEESTGALGRYELCNSLYASDQAVTFTPNENDLETLSDVPLYLENAYKLGFMVVDVQLFRPPEPRVVSDTGIAKFNFLDAENLIFGPLGADPSETKHDVRVVVFKVPITGTNNIMSFEESSTVPPQANSGLELVQKSILSSQQQSEQTEFDHSARAEMREYGQLFFNINLSDGNFGGQTFDEGAIKCSPTQEPCRRELVQALISYVSGADMLYRRNPGNPYGLDVGWCGSNPQDIPDETSGIFDSGAVSDEDDLDEVTLALLESVFGQEIDTQYPATRSTSDPVREFDFLSEVDLNPNTRGKDDIQVTTYLVIPIGVDLELFERTLTGRFFEVGTYDYWKYDETQRAEVPWYFKTAGFETEFEGSETDEIPTNLLGNCIGANQNNPNLNLVGLTPPERESRIAGYCEDQLRLNVEIAEEDPEDRQPRYPGAILGHIMRQTQQALVAVGSDAYEYIRSCQTTTDYLLGRCGGASRVTNQQGTDTIDGDTLAYLQQPVAECTEGISMTAGGGVQATQVTGQTCPVPNSITGEFEAPTLYDSKLAIDDWANPNDGTVEELCGTAATSRVACTFGRSGRIPLYAHLVDETGRYDPNGVQTACEYVVNEAKAAGVSPRLVVALWGEESGYSSYRSAWDLGVAVGARAQRSSEVGTLQPQVEGAIAALRNRISNGESYYDFLFQYSEGVSQTVLDYKDDRWFCANPNFPTNLKDFYCSYDKDPAACRARG